jgi:vacuolar iron transporter family protein
MKKKKSQRFLPLREYLDEAIYGANDGIITTFAVVSGASGAMLGPQVILILGLANLLADGFSMGASNFLAIKTERDIRNAEKEGREGKEKKINDYARSRSSVTFLGFVCAGFIPLLPFLFGVQSEYVFLISALGAGTAFFIVGASRAFFTKRSFFFSGCEMLFIGGIASVLAYATGFLLEKIV